MKNFIVLEGIDGSGKTQQSMMLAKKLRHSFTVIETREPGGSPIGESLRHVLLKEHMSHLSETLLFYAARHDHLSKIILPALDLGSVVICDRFNLSSYVYQGCIKQIPFDTLRQLDSMVITRQPDITIVLKVNPDVALKRIVSRNATLVQKFERLDGDYLSELQYYYLESIVELKGLVVTIDANRDLDVVHHEILDLVTK